MPQGLADYYKQMQKDWEDAQRRLEKNKPKQKKTPTPTPTPTPTKRIGGDSADFLKRRVPLPTRAPTPRRARPNETAWNNMNAIERIKAMPPPSPSPLKPIRRAEPKKPVTKPFDQKEYNAAINKHFGQLKVRPKK